MDVLVRRGMAAVIGQFRRKFGRLGPKFVVLVPKVDKLVEKSLSENSGFRYQSRQFWSRTHIFRLGEAEFRSGGVCLWDVAWIAWPVAIAFGNYFPKAVRAVQDRLKSTLRRQLPQGPELRG